MSGKKLWKFKDFNNNDILIDNLPQYCIDNNLNFSNIVNLAYNKRIGYRGYYNIKIGCIKVLNNTFIDNYLKDTKGNLKARFMLESWWRESSHEHLLDQLIDSTSYLDQNTTITERIFNFYYKLNNHPTCIVCNLTNVYFQNFKNGYKTTCSLECSNKNPIRNQKIKDNTSNETKKIRLKKASLTNLKRYGVECIFPIRVKEIQQTKLEKYGNKNYNNSKKNINTRIINGTLDETLLIEEKFKELYSNYTVDEICNITGFQKQRVMKYIKKYNIFPEYNYQRSQPEQELYNYIQTLIPNENIILNSRKIIKNKELDIYIPNFNLAIEYNGNFWHSDNLIAYNFNKNSHLTKTNLCNEQNIKLIQFWSSEWTYKQEICKSIIKNSLGISNKIYARKTTIKELTNEEYRKFMNDNHIQGYAHSNIKLGLIYNNEIVYVIGISKSRYNKKYEYELIRAANKINFTVVGGLSKLLKASNCKEIFTYCDRRLFNGIGYEKVGFKFLYNTKPNYYYLNNKTDELMSRIKFQRHKLENYFNQNFDSTLSETAIMKSKGLYQIYDCGNSAWVLNY